MTTTEQDSLNSKAKSDYFLTADLSQRLDLIRHLLANTGLIPFVQAREGSGKTRLARHLADIMADQHTVSLISGVPLAGINELRRALAEISGLDSHSELSDALLEEQFCKLAERNKTLLLLLDDADQLAADSLSWITDFFSTQAIACNTKVVVFSAVDVLALPLSPVALASLKDTIQVLDIPPFTKEQTRDFVDYVQADNMQAEVSNAQIEQLYRDSGGNPGQVLWQIQFASFMTHETGADAPAKESWLKPFLLASILGFLLLAGAIFYYQDEINNFISQDDAQASDTADLQTLVIPPREQAPELRLDAMPAEELDTVASVAESEEIITPQIGSGSEQLPLSMELANHDPRKFDKPAFSSADAVEPVSPELAAETAVAAPAETTAALTTPEPAAVEEKVTEATDQPTPKAAAEVTASQAEPETPKLKVRSTADMTPSGPNDVVVSTSDVVAAAVPDGYKSTEWLLDQPDSHFSLQLLAVSREAGIREFVKRHNLRGDLVMLRYRRNGAVLFALLYGNYPSRETALAAVPGLPKSLKNIKPWPRSVASVRDLLQAK
ncbi:MAG: AAA family ATPase [Chromatiales bacterium]|jgi:septal ring-binding cell division protein DamX